jgi:hypothetical protein
MIPFWLLSLYLTARYLKTGNKWMRNSAAIIAGALSLAKVPWLVVTLSLGMVFLYRRKWKDALFVGVVGIGFFSLFLIYGLYFDRQLFFDLWRLQVARYDISFDGLYSIFTSPLLVDRYFLDGWILFGWMSILFLARDVKKHLFVLLAFIAYFIMYVFAIPNEPSHGWYRYPFYPFLIIAIALFLKEYFAKNLILTFLFLVLVGSTLFQNTWVQVFGFSYFIFRLIIIGWSLSLVPLFMQFKSFGRIAKFLAYLWFVIFIILNIWSVMLYNEQ